MNPKGATTPFQLKTHDGLVIAGNHYKQGHSQAVIITHGFFINKDAFLIKRFAEDLSSFYDVITFDLRGHGKSGGWFTWTSSEPRDFEKVFSYTRDQGYSRIGVIGFSLGAAIALISAAKEKSVNSLIAVSTPMDLWKINFHFWEPDMLEDLKMNLGPKGKGKGVLPGNPFQLKTNPVDIVGDISPIPLLLIHGSDDWLIKPYHSQMLFEKAREPKQFSIIPKAGHAERIYDTHPAEFLGLCTEWFRETLK